MNHAQEYTRKAIHMGFGIIFIALIQFAGVQTSTLIIGLCLIAGGVLSLALMRGHDFPLLRQIVEMVERDNEKHFPGRAAVHFFIAAIILLILFKDNQPLIIASLCVQVFADSTAALIGLHFGKHKLYKKKTWEGSAACLITAIICINLFFPLHIEIIGGIIATLVELLPLDDNFWVPLATATAIRLLI